MKKNKLENLIEGLEKLSEKEGLSIEEIETILTAIRLAKTMLSLSNSIRKIIGI